MVEYFTASVPPPLLDCQAFLNSKDEFALRQNFSSLTCVFLFIWSSLKKSEKIVFSFKSLQTRGKIEFGFDHNATESRFVAKRMSEDFSSCLQAFE
ncbi:MAG: hypothetical protein OXJ52_08005 [Oligoflexia bacterium]|nr:hypothetical protein [Oligoflexia bacterium]